MKLSKTIFTIGTAALLLTGCEGYGRPELQPMSPTVSQQMQMPGTQDINQMNTMYVRPRPAAGSLWQPDSNQFFKDPRAAQVGDILTIIVAESAQANSEANTETTHQNDAQTGVSALLRFAGETLNPGITQNFSTNRDNEFTGEGQTDRSDSLDARIAAVVTTKLPNGYLVVEGRREVLVNYEKQILTIQGVVRPEDIAANNTISSDKVAEARISYNGHGVVDEVQQQPYGARFLQRWLPF